jgi:DNA-binding transcriptional LysR family regulator
LLLSWLPAFLSRAPNVAVRALIFGFEEDLMQALIDGRANLGVMYTPQARPGLTIEPLLVEHLVMVSTQHDPPQEPADDYVYVDWGPEFFAQHCLAFPNFVGAALTVNVGWLGLQHVLAHGGTGYFPARSVREHESRGQLHRVPGAPQFHLSAYLCYSTKFDSESLSLALETIRHVASETS